MAVDVDVVIVGFGPGGAVAASLLGQAGVPVRVMDKAPGPYGQPRMSTLDGEIARVLQHTSDPAEAMLDAIQAPCIELFGADGSELPPIDWDYEVGGHWSHYSLHQPNIESAMERRIAACPSVDVRWGCKVVGLEKLADSVEVVVQVDAPDGGVPTHEVVSARYVLGFDGASSFVRKALGIDVEVFHEHDDDWILTDFDALRPLPDVATRTQFRMDPKGPWYLGPNGANRTRTDVRVMPGLDVADELAEERGYAFLEEKLGLTREDVRMTRRVAYRFRSQIARTFRDGRVFIGGDAAHAMTPYMGQGACCAMRDAANIAWKLRLVLGGAADESILDSYEPERMPQSAFFVQGSLASWAFVNETDPDKAAERDAATRAGLIEFPPIPGITDGILHRNASGALTPRAGHLAPQGVVRRDGREGRLDDLIGYGGQMISSLPIADLLGAERRARLTELGVHVLTVASDDDGSADIVDLDGTYARYWAKTGATTLLARADHYLFGLAGTAEEITALVDDFFAQLPPARSGSAARTDPAAGRFGAEPVGPRA